MWAGKLARRQTLLDLQAFDQLAKRAQLFGGSRAQLFLRLRNGRRNAQTDDSLATSSSRSTVLSPMPRAGVLMTRATSASLDG